ncbi:uncharacterized protein LOC135079489 [Ostrinia nubilalis]|uniref:uncharacterized protein LOC135079489 n=1 Tax=Ostrinia nubilalis TaxID=29057 RepID=UPI003082455D
MPNVIGYIALLTTLYASLEVHAKREYIQPIRTSPGLYFDYLGELRIKNGQLNVLIPIDISHVSPHIANIKSVIESAERLCNQMGTLEPSECNSVLEPLAILYHNMVQDFTSISHLLENRSRRSAWIGGGGTILKHIFGTLDEDDGIRYNEAIKTVQGDQKKLAALMKENILVTTSVITAFNKTLDRIKINEANLITAIDKLSLGLQNISIKTDELLIRNYADQILIKLETAILLLSFQIEDIVAAILFSSQNLLHPSILNPRKLYQELAESYRHLPDDSKLPIALDLSSIHFILNISKIASYYIDNKIIFVLQIPLVSTKEFMLFHAIALPTPHNSVKLDSFSLIIPSSKLIAMTKDKMHYCNLENLNQCVNPTVTDYVCDVTNVYASDAKPSCESELMTKVISEIPVQCATKFIYGKLDIWKAIMAPSVQDIELDRLDQEVIQLPSIRSRI